MGSPRGRRHAYVINGWREQYLALVPSTRSIRYRSSRIAGAAMGASNPHSHGQIVEPQPAQRNARSLPPDRLRIAMARACSGLPQARAEAGERIVLRNDISPAAPSALWPGHSTGAGAVGRDQHPSPVSGLRRRCETLGSTASIRPDSAKRSLPLVGEGRFSWRAEGELEKRGEGTPVREYGLSRCVGGNATPSPFGLSASVASLPPALSPEALPHQGGGGAHAVRSR